MNRLVIIGNGFDLAHGLKTKYEDFFYWYWVQRINGLPSTIVRESKDPLCTIKTEYISFPITLDYCHDILYGDNKTRYNNLIQHSINKELSIDCFVLLNRIKDRVWSKSWLDIENEYYSCLLDEMGKIELEKCADFKGLNEQMACLTKLLTEYLKIQEKNIIPFYIDLKEELNKPFKRDELSTSSIPYKNFKGEPKPPKKILLLNFNYTNTPERYIDNESRSKIIYIHGKLEEEKSIIFGYGDEWDDDYVRLKKLNDNECLRNMKSYRYLESNNYRSVMNFIESDYFQVSIMGHSCGTSDGTLLRKLFEHPNCVSIKPYLYVDEKGKDSYFDLSCNISRHFSDPSQMRDKLVEKTSCKELPCKEIMENYYEVVKQKNRDLMI